MTTAATNTKHAHRSISYQACLRPLRITLKVNY